MIMYRLKGLEYHAKKKKKREREIKQHFWEITLRPPGRQASRKEKKTVLEKLIKYFRKWNLWEMKLDAPIRKWNLCYFGKIAR